ncbi:hypothetical protein PG990_007620 [Apiospora arundinis]
MHDQYKEELNCIFNIDHQREESIRKGGARPYGLIRTLMKFGLAQSSDPRDRVYSLLSLCNDTVGPNTLQADYNISPKRLFYAVLGFHRIKSRCGCAEVGGHLIKVLELDVGEMASIILRIQPTADEISQTRTISSTNETLAQDFLQDFLAAVKSTLPAADQTPLQHHNSDRLCPCFIAACSPRTLGLRICISDRMLRVDSSSLALVFRPSIIGLILSGIATFTSSSEPAKQTLGVPMACDEWSKYPSIGNIEVVNKDGWQQIPKEIIVEKFETNQLRRSNLWTKHHYEDFSEVKLRSQDLVVLATIPRRVPLDSEREKVVLRTRITTGDLSMSFNPRISTKEMNIELLCAILESGHTRLSGWENPSNMPPSIFFDLDSCWRLMNMYSLILKDVSGAYATGQGFFKDELFNPILNYVIKTLKPV